MAARWFAIVKDAEEEDEWRIWGEGSDTIDEAFPRADAYSLRKYFFEWTYASLDKLKASIDEIDYHEVLYFEVEIDDALLGG